MFIKEKSLRPKILTLKSIVLTCNITANDIIVVRQLAGQATRRYTVDLHKVDLNLLKVVDAIARTGSVSAAADTLYVSQPAVSNALAKLRKLTGDEIFVRTGSGPSPTPYGNRLIKASQKVMAEANACFSEIELFDPQVHKRTFRIGLQDFLEAAFLPKLMKRFQSFSHVDIRVIPYKLDSAAQDLETGKLDLIVDVRPIDSEEHSSEILLEDEVCIALRRRHPLAEKSSLSTEDFDQLEYVIVRPHQIEFHSAELTLRQMGIHRKVAIETSAPMIVPQIVAETDFASTMPRRLFSGAIAAYKLKTHSMPFEFPPMRLMMVSAGSLRFDPGIRWLKEQFKLLV